MNTVPAADLWSSEWGPTGRPGVRWDSPACCTAALRHCPAPKQLHQRTTHIEQRLMANTNNVTDNCTVWDDLRLYSSDPTKFGNFYKASTRLCWMICHYFSYETVKTVQTAGLDFVSAALVLSLSYSSLFSVADLKPNWKFFRDIPLQLCVNSLDLMFSRLGHHPKHIWH